VLFEVSNDFVWVKISIFQFLMMATTLKSISGSKELGHFLIELRNPE
jgi:hypothetical protein